MLLRLVSWNMAYRRAAWAGLNGLGADVALLQEAGTPGPEWAHKVVPDAAAGWETALPGGRPKWRTAIARLSDRVDVRPRATVTLEAAARRDGGSQRNERRRRPHVRRTRWARG